ncbi:hypothetical protein NIES2109_58760 (plasmid) [Nostoc sp. HK-01]|nr:hypothetical protein NIES2109_58760 [Nostoc sp. HK-01]
MLEQQPQNLQLVDKSAVNKLVFLAAILVAQALVLVPCKR